ncbi:hypothetical protein E4U30_005121 [Claviceps sp. LM220 group G6]|nr:hypothetical protein E4U15_003011 [Claviceps sp. LM218 group G6]KAG6089415.1 hypothetical protein E4U31_008159 [Claviceps sp. LM219 group G6]KAG6092671.1 hypothetical protein E4U30_005121 [Claviceps sp. LM220 group G6]KAG6103262.1 hypothetical protein E4U14_006344 [Claviceps sp. LM454 group G7]
MPAQDRWTCTHVLRDPCHDASAEARGLVRMSLSEVIPIASGASHSATAMVVTLLICEADASWLFRAPKCSHHAQENRSNYMM